MFAICLCQEEVPWCPSHAYLSRILPLLLTYPAQAGPIYMDDF